jgi:hypothetical protein
MYLVEVVNSIVQDFLVVYHDDIILVNVLTVEEVNSIVQDYLVVYHDGIILVNECT